MSKLYNLDFCFKGSHEIMKVDRNEFMNKIFQNYASKINENIKNIFFLINGDMIKAFQQVMELSFQGDTATILVFEFMEEEENENEEMVKLSKDILCPICNEICLMSFKDYKITFSDCKNGHYFPNTLFNELSDFQKLDESTILCSICGTTKKETTQNKFYKCCDCKMNLCPLCQDNHKKKAQNHIILDYDMKNYICNIHGEKLILHCKNCNSDLCDVCNCPNKDHYNYYSFLYKFVNKNENKLKDLRMKIDELKKEIPNASNKIEKIIENLEILYNFGDNIINNFKKENKNYYILNNINNINEYIDNIINDINKILKENEIEKKNNYISEIFEKMIIHSEFNLKYKLGRVGPIKILGEPFVKKNKFNYELFINDKQYELTSFINVINIDTGESSNDIIEEEEDIWKKIQKKVIQKKIERGEIEKVEIHYEGPKIKMKIEKTFEIKLKQIKTVTDISYMFGGCSMLSSVENPNWNIDTITNLSGVFSDCRSLISIPDISKWNTSNVKTMNNLFSQ